MTDTITAIATPVGEGGIGIIRISGDQAINIANQLFKSRAGVTDFESQRVYLGEVRDPDSGQLMDQALLTFFKSPKSYTGEDVVELSGHGGVLVMSTLLQLTLDAGARLAQPGEFTRRAFVNGRLDLSQAEAVTDLIHANSQMALRSAAAQVKGDLSQKLNSMYDRLLGVLAHLEAAIDFPEDDLEFLQKEQTLNHIRITRDEMDRLIDSYRQGKIYREGAKVALVGKPNVGKSSLLNALLQEDRAIVTALPGTTRDTLEERVRIKDLHINIIDSAGIRHNPEVIEQQGIERTRAALQSADLALVLFDGSQTLDENDDLLIAEVRDKAKLLLLNKCDLPSKVDEAKLKSLSAEMLPLSAKTGEGMDELIDAIYQFLIQGKRTGEAVVITRERHRELLSQSSVALTHAEESLAQSVSEEMIAVDVNTALEHLGSILGKTFSEDLLDEIFNAFCIGK